MNWGVNHPLARLRVCQRSARLPGLKLGPSSTDGTLDEINCEALSQMGEEFNDETSKSFSEWSIQLIIIDIFFLWWRFTSVLLLNELYLYLRLTVASQHHQWTLDDRKYVADEYRFQLICRHLLWDWNLKIHFINRFWLYQANGHEQVGKSPVKYINCICQIWVTQSGVASMMMWDVCSWSYIIYLNNWYAYKQLLEMRST